jgi:hypothetical protein
MTVFNYSCTKIEYLEIDNESQSVVDYAIADQEFMSMVPLVLKYLPHTYGLKLDSALHKLCNGMTYFGADTTASDTIHKFTLDLAKATCLDSDGKTYTGKAHLTFTNTIHEEGSTAVIKLEQYKRSNHTSTCDSILVTYVGASSNHFTYNVKVIGGQCTSEAFTIKYVCDKTMSFYASAANMLGTPFSSNYGKSQGMSRTGLKFNAEVKVDIVKLNNCTYFSQGKVEHTPEGFKTKLIDFGDGTCDDLANFTIKENTVAFKLK